MIMAKKSLRAAFAITAGLLFSGSTAYAQQAETTQNHSADNDNRPPQSAPTKAEIDKYYYRAFTMTKYHLVQQGSRFLPYLSDDQKVKINQMLIRRGGFQKNMFSANITAKEIQTFLSYLPDDQKAALIETTTKNIMENTVDTWHNLGLLLTINTADQHQNILDKALRDIDGNYIYSFADFILPYLHRDMKRSLQVDIIQNLHQHPEVSLIYLHKYYPLIDDDLKDSLIDAIVANMNTAQYIDQLRWHSLGDVLSPKHMADLSHAATAAITEHVNDAINMAKTRFPNDPQQIKKTLREKEYYTFTTVIIEAPHIVPHLNDEDKSHYADSLVHILTYYGTPPPLKELSGLFSKDNEEKLRRVISDTYQEMIATAPQYHMRHINNIYRVLPFLSKAERIQALDNVLQMFEASSDYVVGPEHFAPYLDSFPDMPPALQDRYVQKIYNVVKTLKHNGWERDLYRTLMARRDILPDTFLQQSRELLLDNLNEHLFMIPALMEDANAAEKERIKNTLHTTIMDAESYHDLDKLMRYLSYYINYISKSEIDIVHKRIAERYLTDPSVIFNGRAYFSFLPDKLIAQILSPLLEAAESSPAGYYDVYDLIKNLTDVFHVASEQQRREIYQLIEKRLANGHKYNVFSEYVIESYMHILPEDMALPLLHRLVDKHYVSQNIAPRLSMDEEPPEWYRYINQDTIDQLEAIREKRERYLRALRQINDLHDEPDHIRFASLASFDAASLYELSIIGREELYTSSYLGVFARLQDAMKAEGIIYLDDITDPRIENMPATFLNMAMEYGTEKEALQYISPKMWDDLITYFEKQIEDENEEAIVTLTKIIQSQPDVIIRDRLKETIRQNFQNTSDLQKRDVYGLLIDYYNLTTNDNIITLENAERYRIPDTTHITKEQLLGSDDIHRQLMVFTGDRDGHNSYKHMVRFYQDNPNYKIENHEDYTKIVSKSGTPIELYANHPGRSPYAILDKLPQQTESEVEIDFVIHRGHSYNLDNTMPYFSDDNALMFLGSCGGYNNVSRLLNIAPLAQIISTKQTGTMYVNDPLLLYINEQIRQHGAVQWDDAQDYLDTFRNSNAKHYTLPQNNLLQNIKRKLSHLARLRIEEAKQAASIQPQNRPAAPQP
jgi:hypothetical protein